MVDIKRDEDKKALVGTVTVYALALLFILLMSLLGCGDEKDELEPSGGVAVSYGQPDQGGPDNSAAEKVEEEYTPPVEEEYTPDNQLTSDVEEAPAVKKTTPTTQPPKKPTKPVDKPSTEKPKDPPKEERKPDPSKMFPGKSKTGDGKGGDSNNGGEKGKPDGIGDAPDGDGIGNDGIGTGDGPAIGPGIQGGISGFKVAKLKQPEGGVQAKGVIRLKVCVDANGNVIPSSIKYAPDRNPATSTDTRLRQRAITALREFKFTNTTGSSGGCGYINFTFKLN